MIQPKDRYTAETGEAQMTGVQALARLPLNVRRADRARGLDTAAFISGYEGSPLGGYDLELSAIRPLLAEHDIVFRPGVNEELAATSVQGTQLAAGSGDARVDGVTGFWYGKSPGLDRASDALRHANLMGTHPRGGAVAFVGDDPSAKSSTVPGASETAARRPRDADALPGRPAGRPRPGHARRRDVARQRAVGRAEDRHQRRRRHRQVQVDSDRVTPVDPQVPSHGQRFEHRITARMLQPDLSEMERSREGIRLDGGPRLRAGQPAEQDRELRRRPRSRHRRRGQDVPRLRQALRILGLDEDGLRAARRAAAAAGDDPSAGSRRRSPSSPTGLDEIIVVEEKRAFVESAVKQILYGSPSAPARHRQGDCPTAPRCSPPTANSTPTSIAAGLARRLSALPGFAPVSSLAGAPRSGSGPRRQRCSRWSPVRRTSARAARTTARPRCPTGSLVGGGIGCHALVLMMAPDAVGDVTGPDPDGRRGRAVDRHGAVPEARRHLLQNIGDGTFHHSGSLAVRAAVAAGAEHHLQAAVQLGRRDDRRPAGRRARCRSRRSPGCCWPRASRRIIVTTEQVSRYRGVQARRRGVEVWHRDRLVEAQEELADVPGVTVLIHDQECATELRRKRKRGLAPDPVARIMINERVCEGCGDCGVKSNCLSVQPVDTEFGRKTRIDQSSCNKDYSCLAGDCPSFLTVVPGREPGKPRPSAAPSPGRRRPARSRRERRRPPRRTPRASLASAAPASSRSPRSSPRPRCWPAGTSGPSTRPAWRRRAARSSPTSRSARPPSARATRRRPGECDLYLGCDLLVAADARNLGVAGAGRTVAIVSTSKVPTGAMVADTGTVFPDVATVSRTDQGCDPGGAVRSSSMPAACP